MDSLYFIKKTIIVDEKECEFDDRDPIIIYNDKEKAFLNLRNVKDRFLEDIKEESSVTEQEFRDAIGNEVIIEEGEEGIYIRNDLIYDTQVEYSAIIKEIKFDF